MIRSPAKHSLKARIEKMMGRKRHLEQRIIDELKRPAPDSLRLQSLKRLRLRAKDEIGALSDTLRRGRGGPFRPDAA